MCGGGVVVCGGGVCVCGGGGEWGRVTGRGLVKSKRLRPKTEDLEIGSYSVLTSCPCSHSAPSTLQLSFMHHSTGPTAPVVLRNDWSDMEQDS